MEMQGLKLIKACSIPPYHEKVFKFSSLMKSNNQEKKRKGKKGFLNFKACHFIGVRCTLEVHTHRVVAQLLI